MSEETSQTNIEVTALYSVDGKLYLSSLTDEGEEFALKVTDNELWRFKRIEGIIFNDLSAIAEQLEDTELCSLYEYKGLISGTWIEQYTKPIKTLATVLSSLAKTPCKLLRVQRQIEWQSKNLFSQQREKESFWKGIQVAFLLFLSMCTLCLLL